MNSEVLLTLMYLSKTIRDGIICLCCEDKVSMDGMSFETVRIALLVDIASCCDFMNN